MPYSKLAHNMWFFLFFPLFLLSCSNPPYTGKDVLGPDEFVMDSYKIREGKFSILQLEGRTFDPLSTAYLEEYPDSIQEGDILKIALYHPTRPDLVASMREMGEAVGFRVVDGKVLLPDLGAIEVAGLSLAEAREKIQDHYRYEIKGVEVFLAYKDRLQKKVELLGMVQIPSLPVDGKMRLFEALSLARVPTNANFFKSYLVRNNQWVPVDFYKLVKEGDMSQNVVLRGGDKVYVADPSASSVVVLGEVGQERVIDLPDGFMTLRRALGEAKGIPYTGDRSFIQIIRGNMLSPRIYTLNWKHVIHLPSDSLLLMPGDIVYVAATPIASWNRFVGQVLPTLIGLDLILKGFKGVGVNINE